MSKVDLELERQALICVTQQQVLRTNYIKLTIHNTSGTNECSICGLNGKTVANYQSIYVTSSEKT